MSLVCLSDIKLVKATERRWPHSKNKKIQKKNPLRFERQAKNAALLRADEEMETKTRAQISTLTCPVGLKSYKIE